jgi:hypothetical protein
MHKYLLQGVHTTLWMKKGTGLATTPRSSCHRSPTTYIKNWGLTTKADAVFSSEEGRLGFLTPKRYLDDRNN